MRFSVALILTFVLLPIATSFSHAEDIERITVTGKRHNWPDHNVRNFYIHHASRRGLKRTPTSLDFEKFNDEKIFNEIACARRKIEIEAGIADCMSNFKLASTIGSSVCTGLGGGAGYVIRKIKGAIVGGLTSGGSCAGTTNWIFHPYVQNCKAEGLNKLNEFKKIFGCDY